MQSAHLHAQFYHLQILIHRSFIPIPSKSTTLVLPSLTICTNAARACVHLLEIQFKRNVQGAYQNMVRGGLAWYMGARLMSVYR